MVVKRRRYEPERSDGSVELCGWSLTSRGRSTYHRNENTPLPSITTTSARLIASPDIIGPPVDLRAAYEHCRAVTMQHAKTFYFASIFLAKRKREACYAVYAFCRYVDDLVDCEAAKGEVDDEAVTVALARWRSALDAAHVGTVEARPDIVAWVDTMERYSIDRALPELLIEGVMSDMRPSVRYATFDELYDYCYKVASVVGLMTSEIFGYSNRAALDYAVDLGIAMQLTNILRDVGEDLANNRIYLPAEELDRYGVDEHELRQGRATSAVQQLLRFQIDRARGYYARADRGIAMLERDSRLTVALMSTNYRRILDAIEGNRYDVFSRRASIPLYRKLVSVPTLWYRTRK